MRVLDVDYLVVGAGASGMAFTDTLVTESGANVLMVERRHRPGGQVARRRTGRDSVLQVDFANRSRLGGIVSINQTDWRTRLSRKNVL